MKWVEFYGIQQEVKYFVEEIAVFEIDIQMILNVVLTSSDCIWT